MFEDQGSARCEKFVTPFKIFQSYQLGGNTLADYHVKNDEIIFFSSCVQEISSVGNYVVFFMRSHIEISDTCFVNPFIDLDRLYRSVLIGHHSIEAASTKSYQ